MPDDSPTIAEALARAERAEARVKELEAAAPDAPGRRFLTSELRSPKFFAVNRAAILRAASEGRVDNDLEPLTHRKGHR